jgi:hypothetical protein
MEIIMTREEETQAEKIISLVGMVMATPLLAIGVTGQLFVAIPQNGESAFLSSLAFALVCVGLSLSFSNKVHNTQFGAGVILVATAIFFGAGTSIVFPDGSQSTTMIIAGCFISVFFAALDLIIKKTRADASG